MDTIDKLEQTVNELIDRYQKQKETIQKLEKELNGLKDPKAKDPEEWEKEREDIKQRIDSMIETIESLGIKLKS